MPRYIITGVYQAKWEGTQEKMIKKHEDVVLKAAKAGVQILCFQELFYSPYFPAEQNKKWYSLAETIDGHIVRRFIDAAKRNNIILIVPIYEQDLTGVYYNTAVVINNNGQILGKYRKNHLPHLEGFWEKFYFKPGNLGYPVFKTDIATIGVYTCYDRHFPEGARILGLNGAEIVFNPSATTEGLSAYLWKLEQPALAVFNGYFIAAINRVGIEELGTGKFYGSSYICDPKGNFLVEASKDNDELIYAKIDLDLIRDVRNTWQFYRDRRPETYGKLIDL
jgi:N-carbamoylputrescine amidase